MALVERQSTPMCSVQVHGSIESRGSRSSEPSPALEPSGRLHTWIARARANVWTPVVLRVCGVVFGMLALAGIGALATARGLSGHAVGSARAAGARPPAIEQASLAAAGPERARAPKGDPAPTSEAKPSPGVTEDGKVVLNLATIDDLRRLPGVGKKRAESIIALRERLGGRFRRLSDLLRIRGIGPRRLKVWMPLVVLDVQESRNSAPSPSAAARATASASAHATPSTAPAPSASGRPSAP